MKINGTDISTWGATQTRITIGHHDRKTDTQWVPGAVIPIYGISSVQEKSITVIVNVKGSSGRKDIILKRSGLLAALIGIVELELDGYDHKFRCKLDSHRENEIVKERWHQMELSFSGYEFGTTAQAQTDNASSTPLAITNPGNMTSPCRVEITPRVGAASITLTGLCRDSFTGEDLPVIIKNLTTGNVVVIDALTGLITEAGNLKDIDIWALPSLLPGANAISCSSSSMTVKVIVTPLYD